MNVSYVMLFLMAAFCGFFLGFPVSGGQELSLFAVVNKLSFSEFIINTSYVQMFLIWYFPLILFQILWGTYIYKHFCTASVYYFSRLQKRCGWYLAEAGKLYLLTFLYLTVLVISTCAAASIRDRFVIGAVDLVFLLYYLVYQSLWLFTMTLLINLISIKTGSSNGFLAVAGTQFAFVAYFVALENVLNFREPIVPLEMRVLLIKLNPLSHLILKWHSSDIEELEQYINSFQIEFPMWQSLVGMQVFSLVVLTAGIRVIKKQEFIIINRETGGSI